MFITIIIICTIFQEFADFADQISKIEKYAITIECSIPRTNNNCNINV